MKATTKSILKDYSEDNVRLQKNDLLRFFAIILIVNSHLENFYPIPQLAADGFLGNALFFFLSGVGLVLSKHNINLPFHKWYWRRITRIYPSVFLTVLIFFVGFHDPTNYSEINFVNLFLWPTPFSFIKQLMVFYIAYYFVAKLGKENLKVLFLILSATFLGYYFLITGTHQARVLGEYLYPLSPLNWLFYFQVMVLGGLIAKMMHEKDLFFSNIQKNIKLISCFLSFSAAYLAIKLLISLRIIEGYYFLL
jgi:peptidoglycan/LPS O-acetylase OafA/YrhL